MIPRSDRLNSHPQQESSYPKLYLALPSAWLTTKYANARAPCPGPDSLTKEATLFRIKSCCICILRLERSAATGTVSNVRMKRSL
jgi:hypothetical protein